MVGTRPTVLPAPLTASLRCARDHCRSSATVRRISISSLAKRGDVLEGFEDASSGFGQVIAFRVGGESAVLYVFAVVFDGGADDGGGIAIAADKLGRRREGQVDEIVEDEDLSVAVGAGPDSDGGDG